MRLVGIKNSWKYEKDFILLNVNHTFITISHLGNPFTQMED